MSQMFIIGAALLPACRWLVLIYIKAIRFLLFSSLSNLYICTIRSVSSAIL
jgi:hypothetical protein